MRKATWWYLGIAVAVASLVLEAGFHLFAVEGVGVDWRAAWVLTVGTTAGTLLVTPALMTLNGLNEVAATARLGAVTFVVATLATWGLLVAGWGLMAGAIASALGLATTIGWLAIYRGRLLLDLWRTPRAGPGVSWWSDVWPVQWRIAVSWLCGTSSSNCSPRSCSPTTAPGSRPGRILLRVVRADPAGRHGAADHQAAPVRGLDRPPRVHDARCRISPGSLGGVWGGCGRGNRGGRGLAQPP